MLIAIEMLAIKIIINVLLMIPEYLAMKTS